MKIKEVVTEAGILGSIATGAVRMLDKIGGGTGNVGTQAQIAAREKKEYARARATVGKTAFREFADSLEQNKINLQDPRSYDPVEITDYLQNFARNYFAVGDRYHNQDQQEAIKVGVLQALNQMPLPTTINNISVQDYLEKANTVRNSIINQVDKMMATQQAAQPATQQPAANQQTAPAKPVSAGGVTLYQTAGRDGAGQPTPTRVIYQNKQYALQDDGKWLTVFGKNIPPELASFLQQELESIS